MQAEGIFGEIREPVGVGIRLEANDRRVCFTGKTGTDSELIVGGWKLGGNPQIVDYPERLIGPEAEPALMELVDVNEGDV